jgi:menaquinone-dependent protoporphyrinogen IX oxidase
MHRHWDIFIIQTFRMKGIVIYDTKYGATGQYAFWIADEFGFPAVLFENATTDELRSSDLIIIGCPVYIGRLRIKKWLHKNLFCLHEKKVIFFLVGGTDLEEISKIEKVIAENIPGELRSVKNVFYLHGRMAMNKLSLADKILLNVGASLNKDKLMKQKMLTDFDDVRKSNLGSFFDAVKIEIHAHMIDELANS